MAQKILRLQQLLWQAGCNAVAADCTKSFGDLLRGDASIFKSEHDGL
jgi:hypothetical protein